MGLTVPCANGQGDQGLASVLVVLVSLTAPSIPAVCLCSLLCACMCACMMIKLICQPGEAPNHPSHKPAGDNRIAAVAESQPSTPRSSLPPVVCALAPLAVEIEAVWKWKQLGSRLGDASARGERERAGLAAGAGSTFDSREGGDP